MQDKPKVTPKDFFLWAGAMVALYWSVIAFVNLAFNYIDYAFPNALSYYPADPYQTGIGFEMASLVVLMPIFLVLMRIIRREIARDESRRDIWVRRWALYLVLFIAGIAMAGDLIVLLNTFFSGEALTTAFLLKIAIVFLVAVAGFMHFIADVWGYWTMFPERAQRVAWAVGVLIVVVVGSGFLIVGTPHQARLARFDAQRVQDLQEIQSRVIYIWQQKGKVPQSIAELQDPLSDMVIPTDPETKAVYEYKVVGPHAFSLCATFDTIGGTGGMLRPGPEDVQALMNDNWLHDMGHVCFLRTIDTGLYPVVSNTSPATVPVVKR